MGQQERSPKKDPRKLDDILVELFAKRGYAQAQASEELEAAWQESVEECIKNQSRAKDVKRGVLTILASNPTIVQELSFQQTELLNKMQQHLPQYKIKSLRFRLGTVR